MRGQRLSQPTPTSLGQGCVFVFTRDLPPALLAEWLGSFTCHCGNTGMERTPTKSQHRKLTREENSPAAPAGSQTRNLSITSPALSATSYPGQPDHSSDKLLKGHGSASCEVCVILTSNTCVTPWRRCRDAWCAISCSTKVP